MASTSPKRFTRRWIWALPALLLGLIVVVGDRWILSTGAQAPAQSGNVSPEKAAAQKGADVYTVAKEDITRIIIITGELQASNSREILVPVTRASSSSTITFLAPEGKEIKKGQRLIEFDASNLLSQMAEQQRSVEEGALNIEKISKPPGATCSMAWPRLKGI